MTPAVINVLIDYVLRINNNKLVKAFVETIAGQWSRKKIETVEEAMETAKKNYKKPSVKTGKVTIDKNVPTWFNNNDIKAEEASDEEVKAMEEMLKEFR